ARSAAPVGSSSVPRCRCAAIATAPSSRIACARTAAITTAKKSFRRVTSNASRASAMPEVPRIGVDAMGGDFGPAVVAEGTVSACREMPGQFHLTLVGDEVEIRSQLKRLHAEDLGIDVVHAPERIEMAEKAAAAVRRKTQSSLGVLTQLH